ncbi:hypothetical protein SCA6_000631 [Theobroma cacao]
MIGVNLPSKRTQRVVKINFTFVGYVLLDGIDILVSADVVSLRSKIQFFGLILSSTKLGAYSIAVTALSPSELITRAFSKSSACATQTAEVYNLTSSGYACFQQVVVDERDDCFLILISSATMTISEKPVDMGNFLAWKRLILAEHGNLIVYCLLTLTSGNVTVFERNTSTDYWFNQDVQFVS